MSRYAATFRDGLRRTARTRPRLAGFALGVVVLFALAQATGADHFYYDAANYWSLREAFGSGDHFSLVHYGDRLRGYLFPLILRELDRAGGSVGLGPVAAVKLMNAGLMSALTTVLGPALAEVSWSRTRWTLSRRLVLLLLFALFWHGYLDFPLTDLPALAAVLTAVLAIAGPLQPARLALAGAATAAAIDLRPAYVLLVPAVGLLLLRRGWRAPGRMRLPRVGVLAACVLLGFGIVSLPQSLISQRHFGSLSPVPGAAAGLAALQYTEGLRLQRYDTYVRGDRPPQMLYLDPAGERVLSQAGGEVSSFSTYVGLLAKHPLAMLGVFVRHAVNGLDARYATPYVNVLQPDGQVIQRAAGYAIVFLALMRLVWPLARLGWKDRPDGRYVLAVAFSGATALASAVEQRFLLPEALLAQIILLSDGWELTASAWRTNRRRWFLLACVVLAAGAAAIVVRVVTSGASSHLRFV